MRVSTMCGVALLAGLTAVANGQERGRSRRTKAADAALAKLEKQRDDSKLGYHHTTIGAMAAARRSPHPKSALAIGQPVPEIVGRDHAGEPMKLSDHKGKVIVLDFWGDW